MKQTLKVRVLSAVTAVATVSSIFLSASFTNAASATTISDTLTRLKVTTSSTHALIATFPAGTWDNGETVTFDYSVAANGNLETTVTTSSAALSTSDVYFATISGSTLTLTCQEAAGCSGTLSGPIAFDGTNASSAGSKKVTIAGDGGISGAFAIPIVDDDQITVTASVDPTITFNVSSTPAVTACDGTVDGNGGTVNLGTIAPNTLVSSDANGVEHICTRVSTNATLGAAVSVLSANASLKSASVAGDTIPSATETLSATGGSSASQGYGLCAGTVTGNWGMDTTVPAGSMPTSTSPYNSTTFLCNSTSLDVGLVDGTARGIVTIGGPVGNAFTTILVKAMIDATQPAHNDYTDTLTFIATGVF
ncbi:hypothetical protein KKD42_02790 [Patescibacteria group bacterium]|nr:hypothetical protein [Patescibacteria group bacterium]